MMNARHDLSYTPSSPRTSDQDIVTTYPKVARRPAQWKRHRQEEPYTAPEPANKPATSRTLLWQEDAHFSTIMVMVVLMLNIVLFTTTQKTATEPKTDTSIMIQQITRTSVLPTPRYNAQEKVNSFITHEKMDENAAIRSFTEEHEKLLKQLERAPLEPYAQ